MPPNIWIKRSLEGICQHNITEVDFKVTRGLLCLCMAVEMLYWI